MCDCEERREEILGNNLDAIAAALLPRPTTTVAGIVIIEADGDVAIIPRPDVPWTVMRSLVERVAEGKWVSAAL